MPDIQIEKESKFKKLSKDNRDELASTISKWWSDFHEKRFLMHIFDAASYLVERYFLIKPEGDVVYSDK